ncbi:MAG: hypothetical protein Q9214_007368, partial [Letrouitia sp. 1 TL-2023]
SFFQLIQADYNVRKYIAYCIERYAKSITASHPHHENTAFQVAFCYYLGFGVPQDQQKAQQWLEESSRPPDDLYGRVEFIKNNRSPRLFVSEHLMTMAGQGYLHDRSSNTKNVKLNDLEKKARIREVKDVASIFGNSHHAVHQLRCDLSMWLKQVGLVDEAEAVASAQMHSLLNDAEFGGDQESIEVPPTVANQHGRQTRPLVSSATAQAVVRSPILYRVAEISVSLTMARLLIMLVDIYMCQSRWIEAEWLCLKVRSDLTHLYDEQHFLTLYNLLKEGQIYENQGRSEEAEDAYRHTLDMCIDRLGKDHWLTIQVSKELVELYHRESYHWKDLNKLVEPVLSAILKKAKHDDASYGHWLKDVSLEKQFLEVANRVLDWDHLDMNATIRQIVTGLNILSNTHQQHQRFKEADHILQQLIKICEKSLPADDPRTLWQKMRLGSSWLSQRKWKKAENLLTEVFEKCGRALGRDHGITLEAA